jgi:hypothetical protein
MKHLIIALSLVGGIVVFTTAEAAAVVCARGVYRAGCVSTGGAAVVRRGAVVRGPVAVRRRTVVRGPVAVRSRTVLRRRFR